MPDMILNKITVKNEREQNQKLSDFMCEGAEDWSFDFNNILPVPEELLGIQAISDSKGQHYYSIDDLDAANDDAIMIPTGMSPHLARTFSFPTTEWIEENKIDEFTIRRYKRDFGSAYWYDWCSKYWGTKWNSRLESYSLEDEKVVWEISTAWSPPFPLIPMFFDIVEKFEGEAVWEHATPNGDDIQNFVINSHEVAAELANLHRIQYEKMMEEFEK